MVITFSERGDLVVAHRYGQEYVGIRRISEQGSDDLFIKTKQEAFINPMDHTNQLQFEIQVTEKDYRTLVKSPSSQKNVVDQLCRLFPGGLCTGAFVQ